MKSLIVYFTFSGNNEMLAKDMAQDIGGDLARITEPKKRGMFGIMLDMLFNRFPKIDALDIQWEKYDHIILIAPIWNYHIAHPMKSFIKNENKNLKNYSFVTLCTGRDKQAKKIESQLATLATFEPKDVVLLQIRDLSTYEEKNSSQHKIEEHELEQFKKMEAYRTFLHEYKT